MVVGSGPPLVLVPGIQGRWEWMRPAVRELATRFRVITFSLTGDLADAPASGRGEEPKTDVGPGLEARGSRTEHARSEPFDRQVRQVEEALDRAGGDRAVVCGVSYGGLVALRLAATRPSRVRTLVLVSTPGPTWRPDERVRRYIASPWMSAPAFILGAPARLWREISAARPDRADRWRTIGSYVWSVARNPASPRLMARRASVVHNCDFVADARAVKAPTLVLTGDPDLDRVVPVAATREYLSLIPGSTGRTLDRTGHIGLVTRAEEFAHVIWDFASRFGNQA